jgi:hypothetical protein
MPNTIDNVPNPYAPTTVYTINSSDQTVSTTSNGTQPTIVGEVAKELIAVDRSTVQVLIDIETNATYAGSDCSASLSGWGSPENGTDNHLRGCPVTVQVSYTFKPVLGFGAMAIKMTGMSTQDHE